ncbi:MAG: LysE family transporter [Saprospiraceae bacterium]|nr:LysE family transporter [Saprospiraceae bacterium]
MEAIAKGILSGLGYGLMLGPLFFLNIRITLGQGVKHGIALVAGAFSSDLCLVLASWWSAQKLAAVTNDQFFQGWFGLVCGALLLAFGISAVWSRNRNFNQEMQAAVPSSKRRYTFLQGFFINTTNPSNWLFWLSVAAVAKSESSDGSVLYARLFMATALITLFVTDLSKVLLAHHIGRRLKPGVPEKIVKIAGIILICLSIWVLFTVAKNWNF